MTAILPCEPGPCAVVAQPGLARVELARTGATPAGLRNAISLRCAFGGMGPRPMVAKRNRPEGYPKDQRKAPKAAGSGDETGAGVPLDSVAATAGGSLRHRPRLEKQGCLSAAWGGAALRLGRGSRCPAPVTSSWLHVDLTAAALFFIARNEGSSMVPDNYACIHRIKY
jgi:hypothetical protein